MYVPIYIDLHTQLSSTWPKKQCLTNEQAEAKQIPLILHNWKATFTSTLSFVCFPYLVTAKEQLYSYPLGMLYQKEANDAVNAILSFCIYSKTVMETN